MAEGATLSSSRVARLRYRRSPKSKASLAWRLVGPSPGVGPGGRGRGSTARLTTVRVSGFAEGRQQGRRQRIDLLLAPRLSRREQGSSCTRTERGGRYESHIVFYCVRLWYSFRF